MTKLESQPITQGEKERPLDRTTLGRGFAGGLLAAPGDLPMTDQTPVILWIGSSPDFADPRAAEHILQTTEPLEVYNNGLQATFLSKPGDILVVQNDESSREIIEKALETTSWMWKSLTGRATMTSADGELVLTDNMIRTVKELAETRADAALRISQVIPEITGSVSRVSDRWVASWNDKNTAIPRLQQEGVPVPHTIVSDVYDDEFAEQARQQFSDKKVVLKMSGGGGGVGVFTNENKGLTIDQALQIAQTLGGRFQIQEFLTGDDWGVVAFVTPTEVSVLSQHKQRIHNAEFYGAEWTSEIYQVQDVRDAAMQTFYVEQKDAQDKGVQMIGFTGADIRDGKVIETNPRETGAIGVVAMLELLQDPSVRACIESHVGAPVSRITTNASIHIPPEVFTSPEFRSSILRIQSEYGVGILTQGINYHPYNEKTKCIFLNDTPSDTSVLGKAEQRFMEEIDALYASVTGLSGTNGDFLSSMLRHEAR